MAIPSSVDQWKDVYGRLPMVFEANQGQTDASVQFFSRGPGYSLFLTRTEAVLVLSQTTKTEQAALRRALVRRFLWGGL